MTKRHPKWSLKNRKKSHLFGFSQTRSIGDTRTCNFTAQTVEKIGESRDLTSKQEGKEGDAETLAPRSATRWGWDTYIWLNRPNGRFRCVLEIVSGLDPTVVNCYYDVRRTVKGIQWESHETFSILILSWDGRKKNDIAPIKKRNKFGSMDFKTPIKKNCLGYFDGILDLNIGKYFPPKVTTPASYISLIIFMWKLLS